MDDPLKATLLERIFQSFEYIKEMKSYLKVAIEFLERAIHHFYKNPPKEDWHNWHASDWSATWADRVVFNLKGSYSSTEDGIAIARQGKISTIRNASGNLHGIFPALSNMGWKWWDYTDPALTNSFYENLVATRDRASLIW